MFRTEYGTNACRNRRPGVGSPRSTRSRVACRSPGVHPRDFVAKYRQRSLLRAFEPGIVGPIFTGNDVGRLCGENRTHAKCDGPECVGSVRYRSGSRGCPEACVTASQHVCVTLPKTQRCCRCEERRAGTKGHTARPAGCRVQLGARLARLRGAVRGKGERRIPLQLVSEDGDDGGSTENVSGMPECRA